jgi:hypothetical protein
MQRDVGLLQIGARACESPHHARTRRRPAAHTAASCSVLERVPANPSGLAEEGHSSSLDQVPERGSEVQEERPRRLDLGAQGRGLKSQAADLITGPVHAVERKATTHHEGIIRPQRRRHKTMGILMRLVWPSAKWCLYNKSSRGHRGPRPAEVVVVAEPHYAEAFAPMEGRCFRMVSRSREGGPIHCPERAAWRGRFCARDGRRYTVDACEGHCHPLTERSRL